LMTSQISISFNYPALNEVMKLIKHHELQIINQEMELTCKMILKVRNSLELEIRTNLEGIESLKIKI